MNLIIDTDPGLGAQKLVDIDDGLAIFMALGSDEIDLKGITVTYGNTPVQVGMTLVRDYLRIARRSEIPSFLGAFTDGKDGGSGEYSCFWQSRRGE